MLTIGELARYAGVTVRAVRHYHATGLLPEPGRDRSGYRRYDAAAVVTLIRIRILAAAGVPLARVQDLLAADEDAFAAAVAEIDGRLGEEIAERERHRALLRHLGAGESLALPPAVVTYLDRLRAHGFPEQLIAVERDSWIVIAAQMPEAVAAMMALKLTQIEDPALRQLYRDLGELADCTADDPRIPGLADRVVAFIEAASASAGDATDPRPISAELIALLDAQFRQAFACAPRLLDLLEQRGWTGWTDIRRVERG